jgi:hypothetical protein
MMPLGIMFQDFTEFLEFELLKNRKIAGKEPHET